VELGPRAGGTNRIGSNLLHRNSVLEAALSEKLGKVRRSTPAPVSSNSKHCSRSALATPPGKVYVGG